MVEGARELRGPMAGGVAVTGEGGSRGSRIDRRSRYRRLGMTSEMHRRDIEVLEMGFEAGQRARGRAYLRRERDEGEREKHQVLTVHSYDTLSAGMEGRRSRCGESML